MPRNKKATIGENKGDYRYPCKHAICVKLVSKPTEIKFKEILNYIYSIYPYNRGYYPYNDTTTFLYIGW